MRIVISCFSLVLSLLGLVQRTSSFCLFRPLTNCSAAEDPTCVPEIRNISNASDTAPEQWTVPDEYKGICPDYENVPNCCNVNTLNTLKTKNFLIDLNFGNPSTGCSICAANMKRFWCKYNCDANQSDFIIPGSSFIMNYTVDPTDPSSVRTIVTSNVTIHSQLGCELYQSCKSVEYTKDLGAMQTYQGLFSVFSSQGITQGNVLMNFTFGTNDTVMNMEMNKCNMVFDGGVDQFGYSLANGQGWCNCQSCSLNCSAIDFSPYIQERGLLDGFNIGIVLKSALISFVILILGTLLSRFARGTDKKIENSESRIDKSKRMNDAYSSSQE